MARAKTKSATQKPKAARTKQPQKQAPGKGRRPAGKPKKPATQAAGARGTRATRSGSATDRALKELRDHGLGFPGAHTKSPWPGHLDLAVNDKTFAYLTVEGEPFKISCKLPTSSAMALMLPHAEPTPYGLGKSGWVSITFPDGNVPVEILKAWIEESYRAQAPKKLVKTLSG